MFPKSCLRPKKSSLGTFRRDNLGGKLSPVARGDSFRPSKGTTFWTSDFSVYNYLVRKKIHSELLEPGRSKNPPNWPGKGKPKRFIGTSLSPGSGSRMTLASAHERYPRRLLRLEHMRPKNPRRSSANRDSGRCSQMSVRLSRLIRPSHARCITRRHLGRGPCAIWCLST